MDLLPRFAADVTTTPPNQTLASFFARLGWDATIVRATTIVLTLVIAGCTIARVRFQSDWTVVFALMTVIALVVPTRNWDLTTCCCSCRWSHSSFNPRAIRAHVRSCC
ncbi:MAG: hypothetical protein LC737_08385, partial [Chloroflexi bacterium]|nr:hypothetical protein [Chloroflexota bacterium]